MKPLDSISKKLLSQIQLEFPLVPMPYLALGQKLGIDSEEVIERLRGLKDRGMVRQVGPVVDSRRLGYKSTLVAMKVAGSRLDQAVQFVAHHPGISHSYERDHEFNFWITLAIPPAVDLASELERLAERTGAEAVTALPATKLFKIRALFAADEDDTAATVLTSRDGALPAPAELSDLDRLVINELQQDLPLVPLPFDEMAQETGLELEIFLAQCRSLLDRNIIRRFSAQVNHRSVGFTANAMTCWIAPPERIDAAGNELAAMAEVSHCYERETNHLWPYNLFAMIHGHTEEACYKIANAVTLKTELGDPVLLFSTKEFKKTRIKYLV
ncbi:MAG: Lrp/AsnC family transcriptional regulator [Chloroflexi bacterium]|nr:Lrp/AsnC family transcriptional regulator [Chloroflexota bacterium]